jgi:hypothetical protein
MEFELLYTSIMEMAYRIKLLKAILKKRVWVLSQKYIEIRVDYSLKKKKTRFD